MGVLSLNLWRTMGRILNDAAENGADAKGNAGELVKKTVGPIKAFDSLVPLLVKVFSGELLGRKLREELERLAGYAKQEKRTRVSRDAPRGRAAKLTRMRAWLTGAPVRTPSPDSERMRTRSSQNPQQPAPIPRRDRIVGAAAAPVICEAAAVPLHWIYDRERLNRALAACPGDDPAFGPPACPYYRVGPGENGCYGDQAMATLRFLAAQDSRDFDAAGFGRFLTEAFGPGSRYGNTSAHATDLYHGGRPVDARAVARAGAHHRTRGMAG